MTTLEAVLGRRPSFDDDGGRARRGLPRRARASPSPPGGLTAGGDRAGRRARAGQVRHRPSWTPAGRRADGRRRRPRPMTEASREYPDAPRVGVGAVVLDGDRVLLVQRGQPPSQGEVEPARRPGASGRAARGRGAPRGRGGMRPRACAVLGLRRDRSDRRAAGSGTGGARASATTGSSWTTSRADAGRRPPRGQRRRRRALGAPPTLARYDTTEGSPP